MRPSKEETLAPKMSAGVLGREGIQTSRQVRDTVYDVSCARDPWSQDICLKNSITNSGKFTSKSEMFLLEVMLVCKISELSCI